MAPLVESGELPPATRTVWSRERKVPASAAHCTEVDGTDNNDWGPAPDGMNNAINEWNDSHPGTPCNWLYKEAAEQTPPTLETFDTTNP